MQLEAASDFVLVTHKQKQRIFLDRAIVYTRATPQPITLLVGMMTISSLTLVDKHLSSIQAWLGSVVEFELKKRLL